MSPQEFTSGQVVPISGIYTVTHAEHRLPHQVTLLQGQRFPACSKCGNEVRFEITRSVAGLEERREQILLYTLPEIQPEPDGTGPPKSATTETPRKHKPRAKAHKKGKT